MTDEEVLRKICRGTTSEPDRLKILYNDGRKVLVKHPGGGFRRWCSPWIVLHDTENPKIMLGVWNGKTVWDCAADANGRITHKRLVGLVESLGLNLQGIRI